MRIEMKMQFKTGRAHTNTLFVCTSIVCKLWISFWSCHVFSFHLKVSQRKPRANHHSRKKQLRFIWTLFSIHRSPFTPLLYLVVLYTQFIDQLLYAPISAVNTCVDRSEKRVRMERKGEIRWLSGNFIEIYENKDKLKYPNWRTCEGEHSNSTVKYRWIPRLKQCIAFCSTSSSTPFDILSLVTYIANNCLIRTSKNHWINSYDGKNNMVERCYKCRCGLHRMLIEWTKQRKARMEWKQRIWTFIRYNYVLKNSANIYRWCALYNITICFV